MTLLLLATLLAACSKLTTDPTDQLVSELDSLIHLSDFNGVVLLSRDTSTLYHEAFGYANLDSMTLLKRDDQFVIGSISKQITAVLVMQAVEAGKINLNEKLSRYYSDSLPAWADSVNIHQLLTHTHGIVALDQPLQFQPGSQFAYSQVGFYLLSVVLEKVQHKSFAQLSETLFHQSELGNTFHPESNGHHFVKGYEEDTSGVFQLVDNSLVHYPAAGAFISTAKDLAKWNTQLHSGQLVNESSLTKMKTAFAVRDHKLFGKINYGYGLLFHDGEEDFMIGATGFAPGFASANFYFPQSHLSLVVLCNMPPDVENFDHTFDVHMQLIQLIRTWQAQQTPAQP